MDALCWSGMVVFVMGVFLCVASQAITTERRSGAWLHRFESVVLTIGVVLCVAGISLCIPSIVRLWPPIN